MRAIRLLGVLAAVMVTPLTTYAAKSNVPFKAYFIKHTLSVAPFNRINANGYFNLVIKGVRSASKSSVTIATYPAEPLRVHVADHTLYIKAPKYPLPGLKKRPVAVIRMPNLNGLVVAGPTNVTSKNLRGRKLNITASGSGKLNLLGVIDVDHIQQTGDNKINIRWVKSSTVYINSNGFGSIRLAGTAKVLYARLLGSSILHAAYLRTHYVQVLAKDKALAYVCPIDTLRAFASDSGNIYYYKYPKNITRNTEQSGNVLQMAWHN